MTTFNELMEDAKKKIDENKEQARAIGVAYKFVLGGEGGGVFIMNLKDDPGIVEGDGTADCTIQMEAKDYLDMVEGRTTEQKLFFAGRLKVTGDVSLAMKLRKLSEIGRS